MGVAMPVDDRLLRRLGRTIRRAILLDVRPAMGNEIGGRHGTSGDWQSKRRMSIGEAGRQRRCQRATHKIKQRSIITASRAMKKRSVVMR